MKIIDFHAHILPNADHGSFSVDTTAFQLKSALKCGISVIVATPHFYPHRENVDAFIRRRDASYKRLISSYPDSRPEIKLGAEVLICENIEEIPSLDLLCIEGTRTLLLELPFADFFDSFVYSVKSLTQSGYRVVLAHADRYDPRSIDRLLSVGAKIQLNADALSGLFVSKHIKKWIENDYVVALGSDIHGEDKRAYPRLIKAIKRLGLNADKVMKTSEMHCNLNNN